MLADEKPKPRRLGAETALVAVLALTALAASTGLGSGPSLAHRLQLLASGGDDSGSSAPVLLPHQCSHWSTVSRLSDSCMGELPAGAAMRCCGGEGSPMPCAACPADKLDALQCVQPRSMLLQAAPGCKPGVGARSALSAGGNRSLSSLDVANGRWLETGRHAAAGVPPLLFQPAGAPPQRPIGAAEVPGRLWAAGFDRVVVSGDSTVRHVYNRLVGRVAPACCPALSTGWRGWSPALPTGWMQEDTHRRFHACPLLFLQCSLVRQQGDVIDGGGIAHAHYKLRTHVPPGSGSPTFATDELWVSPAANWMKGGLEPGGLLAAVMQRCAALRSGTASLLHQCTCALLQAYGTRVTCRPG